MSQTPRSIRAAFTLVELLVVIAIIGVLVAPLLPAIQARREAARRTNCTSNMRNLGIAMLNFNDTRGHLPVSNRPATVSNAPRYSWATLMLPYFEEQNTFELYDLSQNWSRQVAVAPYGIPNATLVGKRMTVFECPSVPDDDRFDGDSQWTTSPQTYPDWTSSRCTAPADYSPIVQVEQRLVNLGIVDASPDLTGMLLRNVVCTLKQITDGTSHTIMLAESSGRPYVYHKGQKIGNLPDNRINGGGWSRAASDFGLDGSSADGTTFPGPCAINCSNGEDVYSITGGNSSNPGAIPYPFYGTYGTGETFAFHPGGANILFGDDSVRFINEQVDIRAYARLVTRKGMEPVSDSDYQ